MILCKYSKTKLDFGNALNFFFLFLVFQVLANFAEKRKENKHAEKNSRFFVFLVSTQREGKQIVNYLGHLCNIVVEFV